VFLAPVLIIATVFMKILSSFAGVED